jgi:HlyD family secretion protein
VVTSALRISDDGLLTVTAPAQAKPPEPIEKAKKAVETLINRLRGRDMPEGIVKTNGRIEATQVDVAAKYPGRLATLTVDEAMRSPPDRRSPPSRHRRPKLSCAARRRRS